MTDIVKRLEDPEQYIDAVDDAIREIKELRQMLKEAYPLVNAMVGIGSAARGVLANIDEYFKSIG